MRGAHGPFHIGPDGRHLDPHGPADPDNRQFAVIDQPAHRAGRDPAELLGRFRQIPQQRVSHGRSLRRVFPGLQHAAEGQPLMDRAHAFHICAAILGDLVDAAVAHEVPDLRAVDVLADRAALLRKAQCGA